MQRDTGGCAYAEKGHVKRQQEGGPPQGQKPQKEPAGILTLDCQPELRGHDGPSKLSQMTAGHSSRCPPLIPH